MSHLTIYSIGFLVLAVLLAFSGFFAAIVMTDDKSPQIASGAITFKIGSFISMLVASALMIFLSLPSSDTIPAIAPAPGPVVSPEAVMRRLQVIQKAADVGLHLQMKTPAGVYDLHLPLLFLFLLMFIGFCFRSPK